MFEEYENDAQLFVKEVANELNIRDDHRRVIRMMNSVLHTIRDMLTPEESLHFISQLPMLMKGMYVHGWHLGEKPRVRDRREFVERLFSQNTPNVSARDFGDDESAIDSTRAVVRVLCRHISQGEIDDIRSQFPAELKDLWQADEIALNPS